MMSNDSEVKCFCIGLGLGVAAGFLFAPKSGAETRQLLQSKTMEGTDYIKNKTMEGSDYIRNKTMEGTDYVRNQTAQVVNAASDAVERGGKTMRHKKENVFAAVEAGKAAYNEASAATPVI
jgi:gas vesicle protein